MNPAPQLELAATPAAGATKRTRGARRQPATAVAIAPEKTTASVPALRNRDDSGSGALMALITRAATDPTFDVAKLEKLFEVKERWEANEARKAFVEAKAAFKAKALTVTKNKMVGFDSTKASGGRTEYHHATLDNVVATLTPALSEFGLSHSWETKQHDGGMVEVTCILTHVMGHSERVSLKAGRDDSGSKNNIQAVASTVTYLERYTFLAITGTATKDQDNDGNFERTDNIDVGQKAELVNLIRETNADTAKFCKFLKIANLDELPSSRFNEAKQALEAKKKASPK